MKDHELYGLYIGILAILVVASVAGFLLEWKVRSPKGRETVDNINARIRAWWWMVGVFAVVNVSGMVPTVILFGVVSFLALREFLTLSPTRRGDHTSLLLAFFVVTPLQYWLVAIGWYGMFSILIPVYTFLFVPTMNALRGDSKQFLERTAKLQWALMVCVYSLSHAPALLMLEIPGYHGENAKLLLYLMLIAQLSDVLQYIWGKSLGKRKVAPLISPNKTVEGLVGGVLSVTAIGTLLYWATPFTPLQSAGFSLAIALSGFAGGLTMSAIKRDRGVKDYGTIIEGHGGVLDRLDSICFAAPILLPPRALFFQCDVKRGSTTSIQNSSDMLKAFLRSALWLIGWRSVGTAPNLPRYVLICSPHTSNWDFLMLMTWGWLNDVPLRWMGKDTIFRFPFGWFFRALGGIPIDRSKSSNTVAQMIEAMKANERIVISIPPEGTRKKMPYWKSGFYHVAHGAGVPVLCCYVHAPDKVFGSGPLIYPTGDMYKDIEKFREFYEPFIGVNPDGKGEAAFKPPEIGPTTSEHSPGTSAEPPGRAAVDPPAG